MSLPNEKQLNQHLRRAVSAIPENRAEELWNTPVEKAGADAWFLQGTAPEKKHTRSYIRWASLAAACFVIVFLVWFRVNRVTDTTVYLDVNPSITLNVNRIGKVVRAEADNEDGRMLLDDMDLRGVDVDVAVNALLGSMIRNEYLSLPQNTLLISVNGKNETRSTQLRQKISANAEQTMETLLGSGVVLEQTIDLDDAAEDIAEHYGITPGKAALIIRILKDQPAWSVQDLAAMPMADLIRYCRTGGIDISLYLGADGEVIGDLGALLDDDDLDDVFDDDDDDLDDDHDDDDHDDDDLDDDDLDDDDLDDDDLDDDDHDDDHDDDDDDDDNDD